MKTTLKERKRERETVLISFPDNYKKCPANLVFIILPRNSYFVQIDHWVLNGPIVIINIHGFKYGPTIKSKI